MSLIKSVQNKPIWKKPEGITQVALLGGLGLAIYKFLPLLLLWAENVVYRGVIVGVAAVTSYLIIDNRSILFRAYKLFRYRLTNWFKTIDPIGLARIDIAKMVERRDTINSNIEKLAGGIRNTSSEIEENNKVIRKKSEESKTAQELNMGPKSILAGKEAIRLQQWNNELQPILDNMVSTQTMMKQMYDVADFIITDKTGEIDLLEKKWKSVKYALTALRSAQEIMAQDEDESSIQQSIEIQKEKISTSMGEMDRILELASPFTDELNLRNAMTDKKVMEMLKEFNAKEMAQGILSLSSMNPTAPAAHVTSQNAQQGDQKFGKYFQS